MNVQALLREIPSTNRILEAERIKSLCSSFPRWLILDTIQKVLDSFRADILSKNLEESEENNADKILSLEVIIDRIEEELQAFIRGGIRKVINATGVILHTNLGRAPLAKEALQNIQEVANGYCNLEISLDSGERRSRHLQIKELLHRLTGAEGVFLTNNNAAALFLILNTLSEGKEVIVSRGELIEIGGYFRLPEILRKSGARLIEVGTTNRTNLTDYEDAITSETALLLKVHKSNFKILGYGSEVSIKELVMVGRDYNLPVCYDLGSGSLLDLSRYGLSKEPTPQESIASGVDLITFSGDKLLGGPQAGIILGRLDLLERLEKNPLSRTLRIDKLNIAALEATLRLYLDEQKALESLPVLKMALLSTKDLEEKALFLWKELSSRLSGHLSIRIADDNSQIGGGSLPLELLPTKVLAIKPLRSKAQKMMEDLRKNRIPILSRIKEDEILLDVRTIEKEDFHIIWEALADVVAERGLGS